MLYVAVRLYVTPLMCLPIHVVCTSHHMWYVPHITCGMYLTSHVVCTSHHMWYVSHITCGMWLTIHTVCTSHHMWYVPHITCCMYLTSHLVCTTHHMWYVPHITCCMWLTIHTVCHYVPNTTYGMFLTSSAVKSRTDSDNNCTNEEYVQVNKRKSRTAPWSISVGFLRDWIFRVNNWIFLLKQVINNI